MKYFRILCSLCFLFFLTSCDYIIERSWNYRITVEVETPEGVKTGSAVRQVRASKNLAHLINPAAPAIHYKVIGEAVVVDLGERGILYSLIDWNSYEEVYSAYGSTISDSWQNFIYFGNLQEGSKQRLQNKKPVIVGIDTSRKIQNLKLLNVNDGINQPKTYEEVFGQGVALKAIEIEITNDPVTYGIIERYYPDFTPGIHYIHKGNLTRR